MATPEAQSRAQDIAQLRVTDSSLTLSIATYVKGSFGCHKYREAG